MCARMTWRAPAYTASATNTATASEVKAPSENTATKSRSTEAATVLMPASRANSRSTCRLRARKGVSSSSEARNRYQATEAPMATPWATPGRRADTATAVVTSSSVTSVIRLKRRITMA